ncbi:cytochrome P450 [Phytohabitans suffuscus]|nr:cytochrome P450 [Phytohabitans suffuscus]
MSSDVDFGRARKARRVPLHRTVRRLIRDPMAGLQSIAQEADGEIVRLQLGWFRPYLVTHPDHVQRILRDEATNYVRQGMFWSPLSRLFGQGILSDGPPWESSRRNLQPLFTAKRVDALMARMAAVAHEAVDDLARHVRSGEPVDVATEMSRVVNRTIIRVFFADRIPPAEADQIIPALYDIATSMVVRMALPWAPQRLPLPGDRAFHRGVGTIDDVLLPVIRDVRRHPDGGDDVIATLCAATGPDGAELTERQVRDDVVTMFITATETTSLTLTWLWPILRAHPDVARRLYDEIDSVLGDDRVRHTHVPRLHYVRAVLDELLRLYPVGWIFPRTALAADVLGDTRIEAGATLLISPFLTHRMAEFWPDPQRFDPERFVAGGAPHRYAYFPFGGGPHQCLGRHVFQVEAQLIVASVLSRIRPVPSSAGVPALKVAATLLPEERVRMAFEPVASRRAA